MKGILYKTPTKPATIEPIASYRNNNGVQTYIVYVSNSKMKAEREANTKDKSNVWYFEQLHQGKKIHNCTQLAKEISKLSWLIKQ